MAEEQNSSWKLKHQIVDADIMNCFTSLLAIANGTYSGRMACTARARPNITPVKLETRYLQLSFANAYSSTACLEAGEPLP